MSVVVDDLNSSRAVFGPDKDDAPLRVNSNAMPLVAVAAEFLEAITWWDSQIRHIGRGFQHIEFARNHFALPLPTTPLGRQPARKEKLFGNTVAKGLDRHDFSR